MKPITIFRHIDCEGPGYLLDVLERRQLPWEMVCIDQGDALPAGIDEMSAMVFMGGSMSVNDDLPWIRQELELIRLAADRGMPVLGHCLGGQLIARALGANVVANRVQEIGWFNVQKVQSERVNSWLPDVPDSTCLFHWHGEMFELPQGADLLMQNGHCPHQAFALGNMLAFQCHIEMTVELVKEWVSRFSDQMTGESESVQTPEQVVFELESKVDDLNAVADRVYDRWLDVVEQYAGH